MKCILVDIKFTKLHLSFIVPCPQYRVPYYPFHAAAPARPVSLPMPDLPHFAQSVVAQIVYPARAVKSENSNHYILCRSACRCADSNTIPCQAIGPTNHFAR